MGQTPHFNGKAPHFGVNVRYTSLQTSQIALN